MNEKFYLIFTCTFKTPIMSFGTKLKMLRVTNKLNQDKMSKRLKVSQPVYHRYENDEKDVTENDPL